MRTFQDYIDQYGWGGYKSQIVGQAPLVMMLRDEIANPGSTQLSKFDRAGLEEAFSILSGVIPAWAERALHSGHLPFVSLRFDGGADLAKMIGQITVAPPDDLPIFDAAYKRYGTIVFVHGEKDNPFTEHTDLMANDGTVTKDVAVGTNVEWLTNYYEGAKGVAYMNQDPYEFSDVLKTPAIFTNMLKLVLQFGIDTAENVQKSFGNFSYAPGAAAAAIAQETKLAPLAALSDPHADALIKGYIAYFGRPADRGGLQFWVDAISKSGVSVADMVDNFGHSTEYMNLYANSSSKEIVNSLYQHLFNRNAEDGGLTFWSAALDKGVVTLSSIAYTVMDAARNDDATLIAEKVAAARAFTASLDTQREVDLYSEELGNLNARKWLSTISTDHTINVKIVGSLPDVVNNLHGNVDGVLGGLGVQPPHY